MPIVRRTLKEIMRRGGGKVDWERLRATTDEDIERMIAEDPDTAPVMTDEDLRRARRIYNPPLPNVRALRRKLGLSQAAFATKFGFSVRTVQEWEQGRSIPDRPARILLRVIEQSPKAAQRAAASG